MSEILYEFLLNASLIHIGPKTTKTLLAHKFYFCLKDKENSYQTIMPPKKPTPKKTSTTSAKKKPITSDKKKSTISATTQSKKHYGSASDLLVKIDAATIAYVTCHVDNLLEGANPRPLRANGVTSMTREIYTNGFKIVSHIIFAF